ncbi:MAG: PAS domain S-box protein, partial [Rhodospirillales bacterium]|nr:PAS domain S-box protein [Rhodospirillales bacterium]
MPETIKTRVLLIENDDSLVEEIRQALGNRHFSISRSGTVKLGFKQLHRQDFDAVLLDWDDTFENCRQTCIKLKELSRKIPIIVLTQTETDAKKVEKTCNIATTFITKDNLDKENLQSTILLSVDQFKTAALHAEQELNTAIFDSMGVLVVVLDDHGNFIKANKSFEISTGYSDDELINRPLWEFVSDTKKAKSLKTYLKKKSVKRSPKRLEIPFQTWDGGHRIIDLTFSEIHSINGSVKKVVCSGPDITERKFAEETIKTIAEGLSGQIGATFFNSLVKYLSTALKTEISLVGEFIGEKKDVLRTISYHSKDKLRKNIEISATEKVCRDVIAGKTCIITSGANKRFPNQSLFSKNKIESYVGVPLINSFGNTLGAIIVLGQKPLEDPERTISLLKVFAVRAAAELERIQAEATAQRLGRMLDQSHDEYYAFSPDTFRFISVNHGAQKNLGYSMDELRAMTPLDIKPEMTKSKFSQFIKQLESGKKRRLAFETVHQRKDGSIYPVEVRLELFKNESPPVFVSSIQDITKRKKSEEALRQSEQRFKTVFHSSPGMAVISRPSDGMHYDVNDVWLSTMGFKRSEVIGKTVKELDIWASPEQRDEMTDQIQKTGSVRNFEAALRSKSGKIVNVLVSAALIELDGEARLAVAGTDITYRIEAEKALRQSEEHFTKIFHSSPAMISISQLEEGTMLDANDTWLRTLEFNRKEVIGRKVKDLKIWPEYKIRNFISETTKKNGFIKNFKTTLVTKSGDLRNVLFSGEIIELDGVARLLSLILDITEHTKSEEALRQSEEWFSKIFHANPAMLAISRMEDGYILDVNEIWLQSFGFTRDEVVGKRAVDLNMWPDSKARDEFVELVRKKSHVRDNEVVLLTKSGEQRHFLISGEILKFDGPPRLLTMLLDITNRKKDEEALRKAHDDLELKILERTRQLRGEVEERKRTEETLRLSEQRQRDMAEADSDWQWETGPDLKYTYVSENIVDVIGIHSRTLIGKPRGVVSSKGKNDKKWNSHLQDMKDHKPFRNIQYDLITPKGLHRYVKVSGKPVFDDQGQFQGYRGTGTNITAQVEAEHQAAQAQQRLFDAIEGIPESI